MKVHKTHETRMSDSSLYDEKCVNCGATDGRGDAALERICPAWKEKSKKRANTPVPEGVNKYPYPRMGSGPLLLPRPIESIAILGMAGTAAEFPGWYFFNKEKVKEVWTCNMGCLSFNSDLNFSMHTKEVMEGDEDERWFDPFADKYEARKTARRLYRLLSEQDPSKQVTPDGSYNSLEYPLGQVVANSGPFLMNTLTYMLAFAGLCNPKTIYLFGCEFDSPRGIEQGHASFEWTLGFLAARGVRFVISPQSTVMDFKKQRELGLYGYGYRQPTFNSEGKLLSFNEGRDSPSAAASPGSCSPPGSRP